MNSIMYSSSAVRSKIAKKLRYFLHGIDYTMVNFSFSVTMKFDAEESGKCNGKD